MPIPDYQRFMSPLLELVSDGKEHTIKETVSALSDHFDLTDEERKALLPSGTQTIVYNRVGWARTYMRKAGLLEIPHRGQSIITDRGKELLAERPAQIDVKLLSRYPEFGEFKSTHREPSGKTDPVADKPDSFETPEEALEYGYQTITATLAEEILSTVRECSPAFFERSVVDLLVKMGYGGSRREAGEVIGKSGDAGIDGIIKEDKLGLDVVYVQAKRWENVVGRPEIQKFAGALLGQKARKGILITTSGFSKDAVEYATSLENKVVLIDGETLAQLMIEHDLGVSRIVTYEVKRIDSDYFEEEVR